MVFTSLVLCIGADPSCILNVFEFWLYQVFNNIKSSSGCVEFGESGILWDQVWMNLRKLQ
jgi:hypothetical protein